MEVKKVNPNIIMLVFKTCEEMTDALVRFQEHYESPYDEIKGRIFTHGYLRYIHANSETQIDNYSGGVTHDTEIGGMNIPGEAFQPFIRGLFDPLTEAEQDIVEIVRFIEDDFCVIGVAEDFDAIDHELSHAFWCTCPDYRRKAMAILRGYKGWMKRASAELVEDYKYPEDPEIILDEIVAYTGPDKGQLSNTPPELAERLYKLFEKTKKREIKNGK